jgi:hypothetical protein
MSLRPPPSPSLVTREAAATLPRWLLWAVCAAWVMPGLIGRDPWRGVDVTTHAVMLAMAEGRTLWWAPQIGGIAVDAVLLPHWLGAVSIIATGPWLGEALAARLPFMALLALTLVGVWHATRDFAQAPAARPLPLAFGGEAATDDYARALADGAALALVATLGLVDVGHQLSAEIAQMAAVAWLVQALAGLGWRSGTRIAAQATAALMLLSACGAPGTALALGACSAWLTWTCSPQHRQRITAVIGTATLGATLLGWWLDPPSWPAIADWSRGDAASLGRLFLWFLWPAWLPAVWTLWRWRHHLIQPHVALPLASVLTGLTVCALSARSDRALLLALPGTAILASFALPTLRRGTAAAIDWFSMLAATATACFIWLIYIAMQTGWPAKPASRVAVLAPLFEPSFNPVTLAVASVATLAWLAAVRWRTGRHQAALWKSMVLPAGGITTCWLLLMTLWLPLVDHDRSPRTWLASMEPAIQAALHPKHAAEGNQGSKTCVAVVGLPLHLAASVEALGGHEVRIVPNARAAQSTGCRALLTSPPDEAAATALGWQTVARVSRPTRRQDVVVVMSAR